MLIEFTFENCYSYKKDAYLSLEAVKKTKIKNEFERINKHRILKNVIIFGANASGKSNIIKALTTFRDLILRNDKEQNPYPTFASNTEPITFSATIVSENQVYTYSVSYNEKAILKEKLERDVNNKKVIYFERQEDKYVVIPEELQLLVPKTRKDSLFLITAKTFNDQECLNVFKWFRQNLTIVSSQNSYITLELLYKKQHDKRFKDKMLSFLQAADFNIIDFEVVESEWPDPIRELFKKSNSNFKNYQMILRHKNNVGDDECFSLTLEAESDGTRKFISLAIDILLKKNKTIVIDEFDNSFHLELSQALIELFNSEENTNQFILTSHELNLMDTNLKKEQIYFTERNDSGTTLYSIYDFKSEENRSDYLYFSRYRNGMFGALPQILIGKLRAAMKE